MIMNEDNITEAVHGLDIFTKNFCTNVKETNASGNFVFRCNECIFCLEDGKCLINIFVNDRDHGYPMNEFGSMGEAMDFPDNPMEFVDQYSFEDTDQVYTNGSMLIPTFRVKQLIEHYIFRNSENKNGS